MFLFHISLALTYGVLLASAGLVIWSLRNKGAGCTFGKMIGSFVFILSLLSVLCTSYYGFRSWSQGYGNMPMAMPGDMMETMMKKMMPKMMERMGKTMEQMGNTGATKTSTGNM